MEPVKKKKAGRELGNAAAAGEILGVHWETYQWYVRTTKNTKNPAPAHVEVDNVTGQRMYPLKDVRAYRDSRPGRGNWGGIGARARQPQDAQADAVTVDTVQAEEVTLGRLEAGVITSDQIVTSSVRNGTISGSSA